MASPHVAGIVVLVAQKFPALTAAQAENILEDSAILLAPGCSTVLQQSQPLRESCVFKTS